MIINNIIFLKLYKFLHFMDHFVFSVPPWDVSVRSHIFTTTAKPSKVPSLPRNEIVPPLSITGLSPQDIPALWHADE
jgi:hypothetical protein